MHKIITGFHLVALLLKFVFVVAPFFLIFHTTVKLNGCTCAKSLHILERGSFREWNCVQNAHYVVYV